MEDDVQQQTLKYKDHNESRGVPKFEGRTTNPCQKVPL